MGTKLEVEHDGLDFDFKPYQHMLEIEGKTEGFEYRGVRNDPARIRYWKKMGFTLCNADEGLITFTGEAPVDGRVMVANVLVVMRRPTEIAEQHREHLRGKAGRAIRAPRERFKDKVDKMAGHAGGEAIDTTREREGPWSSKDDKEKGDDD